MRFLDRSKGQGVMIHVVYKSSIERYENLEEEKRVSDQNSYLLAFPLSYHPT